MFGLRRKFKRPTAKYIYVSPLFDAISQIYILGPIAPTVRNLKKILTPALVFLNAYLTFV